MVQIVGPRILIERLNEPQPSSSLIEVVSLSDSPSQFAKVVAVGSGARRRDGRRERIPLEVGQSIVTVPYCGTPISVNGRDLFMIMEDDALGVVEDINP